MKILLVTDIYTPAVNGVVTSTISLKKALEHLGHEVRVLTLADDGYIDRKEQVYAVSSFNINKIYPGARFKLFSGRAILRRMVQWQPDIIHTQSEFSTFRMAKEIAQYLDIPIVHTYHTVYEDYTHYFSPTKKSGKKIVSALTKKLLDNVDAVITPTLKVERMLKGYGVTQPMHVIPTGIQLDKFEQPFSGEELRDLREHYAIPKDAFLLISLGRLGKEKNVEELLYFLSLLKLDVYFLIAGDGPNRESLINYTQELDLEDQVIFTGMIAPEKVPIYYQMADIFVSASTSETQGLTYIEALASGLPALCRADESIDNVIVDDVTGYQYRCYKEFESCLYFLINNQNAYQKMADNAQQLAFEHYSSRAFGEQVHKIYKKTVASYDTKSMLELHQ